jgi:phosphonate transport system ATP-binding protein
LHQVEYAKEFSERVVGMSRGSVVFEGPSSDLTDEILHRIYYREPGETVKDEA